MPFDDLAADHRSAALRSWKHIRRSELFHLPHDGELDHGDVRSQHDRVCVDGISCLSEPDRLPVLPCKQQLHAEFDSLLWLPSGCLAKHCDPWRRGAESYYGRISDLLFDLPLHYEFADPNFQ